MENMKKASLEKTISRIAGACIEITIRDLREFTLMAEGNAAAAMEKAKAFLALTGQIVNWSVSYDVECDATFAYFSVSK